MNKIKDKVLKAFPKAVVKKKFKEYTVDGNIRDLFIDLTLAEAEKEFIKRTKEGRCLICKKKDKFAKECVCGDCSLRWLEKKGKLKDYIKKSEVGKVIDSWMKNKVRKCGNLFCVEDEDRIIRTDRYFNMIELLVEEELKKELGI